MIFVVVAVGLGIGLTRNPQEIPSALIAELERDGLIERDGKAMVLRQP